MVRRHLRDKFVSDIAKECLDRLLQRYVQELLSRSGHSADTAACVLRDKDLVENQLGSLVQAKGERENARSVSFLTRFFSVRWLFVFCFAFLKPLRAVFSCAATQLDERHRNVLKDAHGGPGPVYSDVRLFFFPLLCLCLFDRNWGDARYNALLDDYPDLTPDIVKRIVGARADCDKVASLKCQLFLCLTPEHFFFRMRCQTLLRRVAVFCRRKNSLSPSS